MATSTDFVTKLAMAMEANNSQLCVGLDPMPERFPPEVLREHDPIFTFMKMIVDATVDLACAYKPNIAFYEAQGLRGLTALQRLMAYIPDHIPVILDAKRSDMAHSSAAYAHASFEVWGADAVTVSPYLGLDALEPFLAYRDKGVFLLCHTSNPGAAEVQGMRCGGQPLYRWVAERARSLNQAGNLGLVVGATYPETLKVLRAADPTMRFLVPGIGEQGGEIRAAVLAGMGARPDSLILSSSRGITYAADPRAAAIARRDEIRRARAEAAAVPPPSPSAALVEEVALALYDSGCVQFGDFVLRTGKHAPIYIDLRLLASRPVLLRLVAGAYADRLAGVTFDSLAAIPSAGLVLGTAVALETGRPLIYVRQRVKDYGTQKAIEGTYRQGERVVVLDDLISSGDSKLEAIGILEEAGLIVERVAVLIDREHGGREALRKAGYHLDAVLTLTELLDALVARGRLSSTKRDEVIAFVRQERAK
ncbi:MAG: orotidine-5'-phosphate decarboxylase [Chloroflexi bacterium]|nr:orotidine-5'-phosphate decarboxylase [Chloroflexota bacterium]